MYTDMYVEKVLDNILENTNFEDQDETLPEDSKILHSAKLIETIQKRGHLEIGYVVPASAFRGTVRKVFSVTKHGLKSSMVIGPNDICKKHYDILIVDEAHRLKRRSWLNSPSMYKYFDRVSEMIIRGLQWRQMDVKAEKEMQRHKKIDVDNPSNNILKRAWF